MRSSRTRRLPADGRRRGRTPGIAVLVAVSAVGLAWAGTAVALAVAGGAVPAPGASDPTHYETEFIEGWLYGLTALVTVIGAVVAAVLWWPPGAVGLAGVVAALWWGGSETVARYAESGWGDGLEVFIYLVPLAAAAVGAPLLVLGALSGRAVRSR